MTFAFGHLISAWLAGKSFEFISKKKLNRYLWFWLIFGGILPDIDYLGNWILKIGFHRTFTHSFMFLILAGIVAYLTFSLLKERSAEKYALALGLGILIHLLIDFVSPQGIPLFWPLNYYFSLFGITLGKSGPSMLNASLEQAKTFLKLAILDMGLGTAWIFYLWMRRRIQF